MFATKCAEKIIESLVSIWCFLCVAQFSHVFLIWLTKIGELDSAITSTSQMILTEEKKFSAFLIFVDQSSNLAEAEYKLPTPLNHIFIYYSKISYAEKIFFSSISRFIITEENIQNHNGSSMLSYFLNHIEGHAGIQGW